MALNTESPEHCQSQKMISFKIIRPAAETVAARLGEILVPGRPSVQTPNYIANTSRGTISHISQDNLRTRANDISSAYFALEDFIEKAPLKTPPIYNFPIAHNGDSRLRKFNALPDNLVTILGPRRIPSVPCPHGNTADAISILTSVGFHTLPVADYDDAIEKLNPDIAVGIADLPDDVTKSSKRRKEKMLDRTESWMANMSAQLSYSEMTPSRPALFAPILPLLPQQQRLYLESLVASLPSVAGLAFYNDATSPSDIPRALTHLPRLALSQSSTPQCVLHHILDGIDMHVLDFIATCSDAGIAFTFTFPPVQTTEMDTGKLPLGIDLWLDDHSTSTLPLASSCMCYTCTAHHRAYIHHLLLAKEMLGWTLLQLHNHYVISRFFADVRTSIARGTFVDDVAAFEIVYDTEWPHTHGQGPRIRGYQFKSLGGEKRKNPLAFNSGRSHDPNLARSDTLQS